MTQFDLPRVGVMSTRAWNGANNLTEDARPLLIEEWRDVWTTPYDTDAHFVCYFLTGTGQSRWPRCNKVLLSKLREVDCDIQTQLLVLDFDNPGHVAWTEETLGQWLAQLALAADGEPLAWQWNVLYTTTNGARLVYVLDEAIPVDQAEGHHRWLCQRMREAGIAIDDIDANGFSSDGREAKARYPTSDWTRCFRLPWVMREGRPTWEDEIAEFLDQPEQLLSVRELGSLDSRERTAKGHLEELDEPQPEPDYALSLLEEPSETTGKPVQSLFVKEAKRRLKGRLCFPCLFKHEPLATEGSRDSTIMKYVGEASTLLYSMEKDGERLTTPEHLYALFLDPVLQLEPDAQTPDWTAVLWRQVQYCWAREIAEESLREEEALSKEADTLDTLDQIVDGMREWCSSPLLLGDEATAREYVFERLLACCDRTIYIMNRKGWYDAMGVGPSLVIPRIRALGMEGIIQTKTMSKDGEARSRRAQDLIDEYGTAVNGVTGSPSRAPGGLIRNMDSPRATLDIPIFTRRDELEPLYNKDVAAWLLSFFGGEVEEGQNWIAHSLAVEEGPIAALSVMGEAGAGKKMLVQGLAECFSYEHAAGAEELTNQFQPGLLTTPILSVDEGMHSARGGKHPADMFRELVGGGKRFVDRKYRAPIEVRNPVRVIFTANNLDVVRLLCGGRDMSPEDRNALAIRILHFNIGDRAAIHLRKRGGNKHTRGWIAGDGGEASQYVVARHFMWLYHNARSPRGPRLLVEGNGHKMLMNEMRTQGGSAPFVIEALIRMVELKSRNFSGLTVEDGRLYVLTSEVLQYFRDHLSKTCSERLTANKIGEVFKGLVSVTTEPQRLATRPQMGRKRWHEIDLSILQKVAREDGWGCERLDSLVAEQVRRGIIKEAK